MTNQAYDRYLADFGERLEAAAPPPRRRRGWLVGAVLVAAALVALAFFLAAPSSNKKLNVVAEARAALPSSGELVHFTSVSTNSLVGGSHAAQQRFAEYARKHSHDYAPRSLEQWSAGDSWRVATPKTGVNPDEFFGEPHYPGFSISDRKLKRVGLTHPLNGPTQEAYDNGTDSFYIERLGVIIRSNLKKAGFRNALVGATPGGIYTGSPTVLVGSDPVAMIRKQLESGHLRDAGTAEVDGRSVRRLVHGGFEYDVDANTFEPVRVRQLSGWVGARRNKPPKTMATDLNFKVFETLPLNSDSEKLLQIQAPSTTKVIDAKAPPKPGKR